MSFEVKIQGYRGIRRVDVQLNGVSVVVGPNGAGKSSLFKALRFMRDVMDRGAMRALDLDGGVHELVNRCVDKFDKVELEMRYRGNIWTLVLVLGVQLEVRHQFQLDPARGEQPPSSSAWLGEDFHAGSSILTKLLLHDRLERFEGEELRTVFMPEVFYFEDYDLYQLRHEGSKATSAFVPQRRGEDAFGVLRNWLTRRDHKKRYEFVLYWMKEAFGGGFEDMDFEVAGQTVALRSYMKGRPAPMPIYCASNGMLSMLLSLTAIASASESDVVCIDEPENGLHPHAIKQLVEAAREWARQQRATILFASPL